MKKLAVWAIIAIFTYQLSYSQKIDSITVIAKYGDIAEKIYKAAMADTTAYEKLAYMCDTFGPRLSGSENLENALNWIHQEMIKDGLANVRSDEVMVPHWERNRGYCELVTPRRVQFPMLAIGGSVPTPPEGITARVIVVKSFEELKKRADEAKGKIVVYNKPYLGYGDAVQFRVWGAIRAAEVGAVASLIKPATSMSMNNPHTGMMHYEDTVAKIPHASITDEDAAMLERMCNRGQSPVVYLYLTCETHPDSKSQNIIGELMGTELPKEIVVLGGHSDSWDAGTGAHDDGAGCVSTWKAVKLLQDLGLKPRRTLRACMFVNEENGLRGGKAYAEKYGKEKHALAFEFDSGVFPPSEIGFNGSDSLHTVEMLKVLKYAEPLFRKIDSISVRQGGGGVDISPLVNQYKVPAMSLNTRDREKYFWYHHSATDTIDKIDRGDFNKCIAAIALAVYIYADLP
jgi:carboxypeptidase Q